MGDTTTPQRSLHDDFEQLCRVVRRSVAFWRRTLAVLGVASLVTGVLVVVTPPVYRSETLILYQEAIRSTDLTGAEGGTDNARRVGARLREALLSRASLEPIVTDLQLFAGREADRHDLVDAVEETRNRIAFKARDGDTFAIAFDGSTPEESQEVTRRLGERIVEYAATRRSEHAVRLKEFLDDESSRSQTTLKEKEAAFATFLAAHPELTFLAQSEGRSPAPRAGSAPPASPADPELVALEIRASRIEQRLRPAGGAPLVVATAVSTQDGPDVVAARKDLADRLLRFTEKHPDVAQARSRLAAAESAQAEARAASLAAAAASAAAAAPTPTEAVDETERAALAQTLDDLHRRIAARRSSGGPPKVKAGETQESTSAIAEVQFFRLQRELNEMRDRQKQLDDRQFKASMMATLVTDDRNIQVSVLDPAYLPTHPISRSRRMLVVAGLLVGLVLAGLLALVSARLDERLYERADVVQLGIAPVVTVIPPAAALASGRSGRRGVQSREANG